MKLIMFVLILTLCPSSLASSDDPLSCVDADIRAAFIDRLGWATTFSYEIPELFADLPLPKGFAVVGSNELNDTYQSVVYKTLRKEQDAAESLIAALENDGWERLEQPERSSQRRGFKTIQAMKFRSAVLCKNDQVLQLTTQARGSATYSTLGSSVDQECWPYRSLIGHRSASEFMPVLDLPPGASRPNGSGSGGSNDRATTRVGFSTKLDDTALLAFFANQLETQGWERTAEWSGAGMTSSAWVTVSNEKLRLAGTLQIARGSNAERLEVIFSLHVFKPYDT